MRRTSGRRGAAAHRITSASDLSISTVVAFPNNLEDVFSIGATFRMHDQTVDEDWNLVRIEDSFKLPQLGVRISGRPSDPLRFGVTFFYMDIEGNPQVKCGFGQPL